MHCSKQYKKLICALMVFTISFGCFFTSNKICFSSKAESISSMKDKISQLDGQKAELESKINSLQSDIDEQEAYIATINSYIATVESKILSCENLVASYNSKIESYNKDIKAKKAELKENNELFKRRIRSIYMSGSNTSLTLLLGSEQYTDFLSMSQFTSGIAKYDNALIKKINATVKEINKKIKKQKSAIKDQEKVKKQLAADRADLQEKYDIANAALNKVNKSKAELKAELDQIEASKAAYENKISAAYEAAKRAAQQNNFNFNYSGEGFAWPLPGYTTITSEFGMRYDPYYGCYRGHKGIDISGGDVAGKPIVASANGVVSVTETEANSGGYGNYVIISHGMQNGSLVTTHYAHMMSYCVSEGQKVKQGDVIGYVGTTGASTGYHLHFEVRIDNEPVNPLGYVSN